MVSSILSKITWGILFGLLIFGMISAFQSLGQEKLKKNGKKILKQLELDLLLFLLGLEVLHLPGV